MKFDNSAMDSAFTTGAFISSAGNVMTASWGFVGNMWGKKVFIAPIRDSRFTKELIDETGEFAVSVPKAGDMKGALKVCGSVSGRATADKWADANLKKVPARKLDTFVADDCEHYFECKVIGMLPMRGMDISAVENFYGSMDLHNFYFGEIVAEY
jgi:flavin reductase (DIM6/NTAB) family NADH-FMN oxidoreductase RutF